MRQQRDREATLVNGNGLAVHDDRDIEEQASLPVIGNASSSMTAMEASSPDGMSSKQLQDEETGDALRQSSTERIHGNAGYPSRWRAVNTSFKQLSVEGDDHTHRQHVPDWLSRFFSLVLSLPIISRIARYLSGPADLNARRQPRLRHIPILDTLVEPYLVRSTRWARRPEYLYIFLLAWFLGFTFLARAAWYNSSAGDNTWISGTTTYWGRNDACGLDGASCGPFEGYTASYRCPSRVASTQLLNYRTRVEQ
jgi:hypothetical protein